MTTKTWPERFDCEAVTADGVCGQRGTLHHSEQRGAHMELYLCEEHWRLWLEAQP